MSTTTPRTDGAAYRVWGIENVNASLARTLETELTAANARIAELAESNAVLQSQVDNADVNLEQVRMTQKGLWKSKVESAEARIAELEKESKVSNACFRASNDAIRTAEQTIDSLTRQLSESQAQLRDEAVKANHAEYYIDANNQRAWRWKDAAK